MPETPAPETPPPALPVEVPVEILAEFVPVPRLADRSNGWKPEVQRAFIEALAETGSVAAACRRVGRSDNGAYQLRRHPEAAAFRAAWDAALALGVRRIEDGAMDRALYGTEETVHYHGEHVATRRRYNERLVMFILRNRAPERFAAGGGPRALNAVGLMERERLRKQWRAEWEAEKEAASVSRADVTKSIERKVRAMRNRVIASTSPRAFEHQLAMIAQSHADEAAGWRPGLPYAEFADKAAELLPKFIKQVRRDFPPHPEFDWCDADRRAMGAPPLLAGPEREEEERKPSEPRVRGL